MVGMRLFGYNLPDAHPIQKLALSFTVTIDGSPACFMATTDRIGSNYSPDGQYSKVLHAPTRLQVYRRKTMFSGGENRTSNGCTLQLVLRRHQFLRLPLRKSQQPPHLFFAHLLLDAQIRSHQRLQTFRQDRVGDMPVRQGTFGSGNV